MTDFHRTFFLYGGELKNRGGVNIVAIAIAAKRRKASSKSLLALLEEEKTHLYCTPFPLSGLDARAITTRRPPYAHPTLPGVEKH